MAPTGCLPDVDAPCRAHRPRVPRRHRPHRRAGRQARGRRHRDRPRQPRSRTSFYDNELLDAHFVTGDGRGNENIGLTAVHHVFHSEHNRLMDHTQDDGARRRGDAAFINEWLDTRLTAAQVAAQCRPIPTRWRPSRPRLNWDGERLFQAAKFGTEMQYQHLVFEEFARKIQPNINVFLVPTASTSRSIPAIVAEFAHVVYRFGHSMLTETIDRFDPGVRRRAHRPDRRLPQSDRVRLASGREEMAGVDHPRHDASGRQRDRRVRHQRAAQQPARPAARPRDHQPGARPRHRRARR